MQRVCTPSAMWYERSVYLKNEMAYGFTHDLINQIVEQFETQRFEKGSAFLKVLYCNHSHLIFQQSLWGEKSKTEMIGMRIGYVFDT